MHHVPAGKHSTIARKLTDYGDAVIVQLMVCTRERGERKNKLNDMNKGRDNRQKYVIAEKYFLTLFKLQTAIYLYTIISIIHLDRF